MQGHKYIFMYNWFNTAEEEKMYKYLKQYFGEKVFADDEDKLWVSEDVYNYVFAVINSYAVYDDTYEIQWIDDCLKWKEKAVEQEEVLYK